MKFEITETVLKKHEHVRKALSQYMLDGKFKQGDRLPSERKLAELSGVNRLTVRRAIKSLCHDGVLRQIPKSGTFVAAGLLTQQPPNVPAVLQEQVDSFTCEDSFFHIPDKEELCLHLEDILPEQRTAWNQLFAEFHRQQPAVRVKASFCDSQELEKDDSSRFDAAIVTPKLLHALKAKGRLYEGGFAPSWYSEHPLHKQLRLQQSRPGLTAFADGVGFNAVPIVFNLPLLFINRQLADAESLGDQTALHQLCEWIKAVRKEHAPALCCPFTQSTLNLITRQDGNVFTDSETIDLDGKACREWLAAKRWMLQSQPLLADMNNNEVVTGFFNGQVAVCELYSNACNLLEKQFQPGRKALAARLQFLGDQGRVQVLPRYLVMLGKNALAPTVALAEFLADRWAQEHLARHQIGLPFYLKDDISEIFCKNSMLTAAMLKPELGRIAAFFDHLLFQNHFQERVLNPLLRMYCLDTISIEQLIHQLKHDLITA